MLGAVILEKHFTHDKTLPGNDHYHAMDQHDLLVLRNNLETSFEILGCNGKRPLELEEPARLNARRSLVAKRDIPEGKQIHIDDITWKRPASGISPRMVDDVLKLKSSREIKEDEVLRWGHFCE